MCDNQSPTNPFSSLYPLTFKPLYKDYLWGGRSLERLGKSLPETIVAESWEISAHHDGMNIIASGEYAGRTLEDLVLTLGERLLGSQSYQKYQNTFPLLLKLIDANEWLSVQVHPDDDYARIHEHDFGKTEMWYVLEAQPGAQILYGLARDITREDFKEILESSKISEVLKSVPVHTGDVIYIPAGTIHAAGKGILIAEVQQNSNATYRLYDYDRKNPDGTSRPLHLAKALDSIDFANVLRQGKYEGLDYVKDGLSIRIIIADPHFCAEIIEVTQEASLLADGQTFMAYTFLSGSAVIEWATGSINVRAGESVLIPANLGHYKLKGNAKALRAYIGDVEKDIIQPLSSKGYTRDQMLSSIGGFSSIILEE